MANINLAVTPSPAPFPFHTVPGGELPYTAVPRGRVSFRVTNTTIAAKIATNTTSIQITNTLPANFAYIFEYAQIDVNFDTPDAANYDVVGTLVTQLGDGSGNRVSQMFSRGVAGFALNAGDQKSWEVFPIYSSPIYNLLQNAPAVILQVNDNDAGATVEGSVNSYISFLQYDIDQIFNAALNFPLPVAIR